jgi:hypothetical protein
MFGKKTKRKLAQAQTACCSHDAAFKAAAIDIVAAITASRLEIHALTTRIEGIERAIRALDAVRMALEAKTWMAYHRRLAGRVKAGCTRAATASRDANGRYLPG